MLAFAAQQLRQLAFLLRQGLGLLYERGLIERQAFLSFESAFELRIDQRLTFTEAPFQFQPFGLSRSEGGFGLGALLEGFLTGGQAGLASDVLGFLASLAIIRTRSNRSNADAL